MSGIQRIQIVNSCTRVTVNGKGKTLSNSFTITLPIADEAERKRMNNQGQIQGSDFLHLLYQIKHRKPICKHSYRKESRCSVVIGFHSTCR